MYILGCAKSVAGYFSQMNQMNPRGMSSLHPNQGEGSGEVQGDVAQHEDKTSTSQKRISVLHACAAAASQDSQESPKRQQEGRSRSPADVKRKMAALRKDASPVARDQAAGGGKNPDNVREARDPDSDKRAGKAKDKMKSVVIEPIPGTSRYPNPNPEFGPNIEKTDRAEQARVRKYATEVSDHIAAVTAGMIPTMLITGAPHFRGFLGCYCVHHRADGMELAATFGCGAVKIMTENGWVKRTLKAGSPYILDAMMTVRYHPKMNNIIYAGGVEGRVYAFNTETVGPRELFCHQRGNCVNALDISTDGATLVTVGYDTAVRVYDPITKQLKDTYAANPVRFDEYHHSSRIFAVRRHPLSTSVFVTGGWDNRVMIWDIRIPRGFVTKFVGAHICGEGIDIHENLLLTASWIGDRALRFWDLTAGRGWEPQPILNRPPQCDKGDYLYCGQFFAGDPTGTIVLIGGSGTKGAMILDRSDCRCHGFIPLRDSLLALDTYKNRIVIGGAQNTLKIGDLRYYTQPPPDIDLTQEPSDDDDDEEDEPSG